MEKPRILLIIPNINIKVREKIVEAFSKEEFNIIYCQNTSGNLRVLKSERPHVLIIESACMDKNKEIENYIYRNCQHIGLIILTNKDKKYCIHALEKGADEYFKSIPKVEELLAKTKVILRRMNIIKYTPKIVKLKDIVINLDTHKVRKNGRLINLTYIQFRLLYLLASHPNYVYTRDEILDEVWGENACITYRTVDVHIKRLRETLGKDEHPAKYIQTLHRLGYKSS